MQIKQLRILSTLLIGFAVGQAGLGSGYLDGEAEALRIAHATNAFAVLVLTLLAAVFGFNYRRSGGPGWAFFMPLALLIMSIVQVTLGFAEIRGFHVFWGALYLSLATAYCSYTWRHRPADTPRSTTSATATR